MIKLKTIFKQLVDIFNLNWVTQFDAETGKFSFQFNTDDKENSHG